LSADIDIIRYLIFLLLFNLIGGNDILFKQIKERLSSLKWRNIRIGYKYLLGFMMAALLFFGAGGIVFFQLSNVDTEIDEVETESILTNEVTRLALLFQNKDSVTADYIITEEEENIEEYHALSGEFDTLIDDLKETIDQQELLEMIHTIDSNDDILNTIFDN